MRHAQGYAVMTDRETGKVIKECDTFKCRHCQRVVHVPPKADAASLGGFCGTCGGLTCPRCVRQAVCLPFEEELRQMEARIDARRSYGF